MGNQTVILACPTLAGELKEAMKEAQSDSVVYFMPPGLHRDPKVLHHYVQDKIDHFTMYQNRGVHHRLRRRKYWNCRFFGASGISENQGLHRYPSFRRQPGRFEAGYAWRFSYGKLDGVHEGILH